MGATDTNKELTWDALAKETIKVLMQGDRRRLTMYSYIFSDPGAYQRLAAAMELANKRLTWTEAQPHTPME